MNIGKPFCGEVRGWKNICAVFLFFAATTLASAQTLTTLVSFIGSPNPELPSTLIQGFDGNFLARHLTA